MIEEKNDEIFYLKKKKYFLLKDSLLKKNSIIDNQTRKKALKSIVLKTTSATYNFKTMKKIIKKRIKFHWIKLNSF